MDSRNVAKYTSLVAILLVVASGCNAFDSGKVYKYDFQGIVEPREASSDRPQHAGLALRSPVTLHQPSKNTILVKLEKPELATFNDIISDGNSHDYDYKPVEQGDSLDKTFGVYFEDGQLKSFEVYESEPKWVSNLKRGLVSLFQIKLESEPAYSVKEKSVLGECHTDYVVLESEGYMNVSKTRNLEKCTNRYWKVNMVFDAEDCSADPLDEQRFKHAGASFNYNLRGQRDNYVIEMVTMKDWARFSAFGLANYKQLVESTFSMRLVSETDGELSSGDGTANERIHYDGAAYGDFYAAVNMEDASYLSQIYDQQASVEQAMEAIEDLVKEQKAFQSASENEAPPGDNDQQLVSSLPEQFNRLVTHISTMDGQKLESVFAEIDSKGAPWKKAFFDAVSVAGTNPTFMFMKKQIENGDLPAKAQKEFLTRAPFSLKVPSKALFDEYINLCKLEKIASQPASKRLCTLPLASMVHQHCVKPHTATSKHHTSNSRQQQQQASSTCRLETADELAQKIMATVQPGDESSIGERMLAIKVAGELGVKSSLDTLTGYVKQRNEHPTLRAAALWNMRRVSHLLPEQVKRLSKPIFYTRNELLEVRIAAFYNWMVAGMELHEMESLAKGLMTEPNRQLVIYVASLVASSAKLDAPCYRSWSKVAEHAAPILKKALSRHAPATSMDSTGHMTSSWLKDYDYGTASLMSMIVSNESFAVSNLYYASSAFMTGQKVTPMTVSVQAHGLDKLVKRVIGINGMISDKENLFDLFSLKKRQKRQAADKIKQEIHEIDKGIELATREFSDVYLAVTVSAFGRIVTFMDIDSKQLKAMASEDGTIKIPNIRKVIQAFDNFTSQSMTVPFGNLEILTNQMGLPIYSDVAAFDYLNFKLKSVKFDIEPGFFKDERAGKPVTKIQAAIDAKMSKQSQIFVSSGVLMNNMKRKIGVGFVKNTILQVPLKVSLEADMADNKIIIKRQPIHKNLYYVKAYPMTFNLRHDPAQRLGDLKKRSLDEWRPLYDFGKSKQMKPFEYEFMTPLAIGLKLEGKHRADQDYSMSSWRRYLATTGLKVARFLFTYSPTMQPIEMRVSTVTTKDNPTKEMTTVLQWKHYHEDDSTNDRTPVDNELEKFVTSKNNGGQSARPTTVAYKLTTMGGSDKERKLAIDLHYSRSADRLAHKWYMFYMRTPLDLASPSSEATNLCWLGQVQFPKYQLDKFLALDLVNMDHSANMSSELTFGQDCAPVMGGQKGADAARVQLEAKFDWSQEQRDLINTAMQSSNGGTSKSETGNDVLGDTESVTKNNLAHLYNKCTKNRKQLQTPMDEACLSYLYKASELTNIEATIDYKNVPPRWTKLLKKLGSLYTLARAAYIDEVEDTKVSYKSDDGQQDRAYLEANMTSCSVDRRLNFKFNTAGYRVTFKSLPIAFSPVSSYPLFDMSYYKTMLHRQNKFKFCSIGGNSVTTFDNMTMTLPNIPDGCFKVLSKDCSSEKNFMVLGAKQGQGKSMTVYVGQKFKIDFVPNAEGTKIVDIKVNDASVSVDQSKPYKKDTMFGPKAAEAFEISYNGAFYTLSSKAYQFSALTDGTWILVNQDKYYAGKSCGICGDDNGEQTTELRSPSGCLYKSTGDFIWSYTVPSTCKTRPTIKSC